MRRFLLILLAAASAFPAIALQKDEMLRIIDERSAAAKTIECDFAQSVDGKMFTSPVLSYGRMAYSCPDMLRWEYTRPYSCVFSVSGGKVSAVRDGKPSSEDAGRVFGQIAHVLLGEVIGKPLAGSRNFETRVAGEGNLWAVTLSPAARQLKQFVTEIRLWYNPDRACIVSVLLQWKNGDKTRLDFSNVKINGEVR